MTPLMVGAALFGGMLVLMALRVPIAIAMFIPGALGYIALSSEAALLSMLKGALYARFTVYDLSRDTNADEFVNRVISHSLLKPLQTLCRPNLR